VSTSTHVRARLATGHSTLARMTAQCERPEWRQMGRTTLAVARPTSDLVVARVASSGPTLETAAVAPIASLASGARAYELVQPPWPGMAMPQLMDGVAGPGWIEAQPVARLALTTTKVVWVWLVAWPFPSPQWQRQPLQQHTQRRCSRQGRSSRQWWGHVSG
jgi:hypothetical protein